MSLVFSKFVKIFLAVIVTQIYIMKGYQKVSYLWVGIFYYLRNVWVLSFKYSLIYIPPTLEIRYT